MKKRQVKPTMTLKTALRLAALSLDYVISENHALPGSNEWQRELTEAKQVINKIIGSQEQKKI